VLNRVLDTLRGQGWIDAHGPVEVNVFLTTGASIWLLLSSGGVRHTYVKFSDHACLCQEAERSEAAFAAYPRWVAEPLGHVHEPGLDILVARAVEYRFPRPARLSNADDRIGAQLIEYFAASTRATVPSPLRGPPREETLLAMHEYFGTRAPALARLLDPACRDVRDRWLNAPAQVQHGDFVLNNLAVLQDRLVIFDWEDFGAVDLPGLDLFTLLLSLGKLDAWIDRAQRAEPTLAAFVDRACTAMGLTVAQFDDMLLLHAAAFRYLKRAYGESIRLRMDAVLDRLIQRRLGASS